MKRLTAILLTLFILTIITGCKSDSTSSWKPVLEITRVDVKVEFSTEPERDVYHMGPQTGTLEISTDAYSVTLYMHVYNKVKIESSWIEIVDENNSSYIKHTKYHIPPLSRLSSRSESWTLGFNIKVLAGTLPEGKYTVYLWVESPAGYTSTYSTVDIDFI